MYTKAIDSLIEAKFLIPLQVVETGSNEEAVCLIQNNNKKDRSHVFFSFPDMENGRGRLS
jgi:hypothetical protein